jgi:hypothetical protein
MIDYFKRRKFEHLVLRTVERRLMEIHGEAMGGECMGFFATSILKAQEVGDIPADLTNRFRKNGFSVQEAALALFDTSITSLKTLTSSVEVGEDVARVMLAMDQAVDRICLDDPGMVVPVNGTAGPMMANFTKDVRLT